MLGAIVAAVSWWKDAEAAVIPLPGDAAATTIGSGAAVPSPAVVDLEQLAAEVRSLADRVQMSGVSLAAFGFKGDGVSDDTLAWRQAIAFAGSKGIRAVLVPTGVSLVTGSIVDAAHPLPPGLTFRGEGAAVDSPYMRQSRLTYSGAGICWDIGYPIGAPASTGRWAWDGLTFQCIDPEGTMFSFGDPLTHRPSDDRVADRYMFLSGIAFRNIMAFGASGTGDFVRACKTFHIDIDALSSVYSFRRAFWLKGCDNCRIQARLVGNNRGVMIEPSGTFGNNNRIDINYISGPDTSFGGEPSYSIYDSGAMTVIERGVLLEGYGVVAHLFLNGYGTELYAPQLGQGAPFFELGPSAREVVLYSPRCTVISPVNTPILHAAENPNFGNAQSDYRMRIVDAPQAIQAIVPLHPRIVMIGGLRNPSRNTPGPGTSVVLGHNGYQATSYICTAHDYWGVQGSPGGGGIKEFVRDPIIANRWVMRLTKDGPNEQGIVLHFRVGEDILPGVYRLVHRMRLALGTSNAGWALIATYDGAFFSNSFTFATASTYVMQSDILDLSAATYGKAVSINLYNSSSGKTGVDLFVEAIGLVPVRDRE